MDTGTVRIGRRDALTSGQRAYRRREAETICCSAAWVDAVAAGAEYPPRSTSTPMRRCHGRPCGGNHRKGKSAGRYYPAAYGNAGRLTVRKQKDGQLHKHVLGIPWECENCIQERILHADRRRAAEGLVTTRDESCSAAGFAALRDRGGKLEEVKLAPETIAAITMEISDFSAGTRNTTLAINFRDPPPPDPTAPM